jgi:hypothetical protein
MITMFVDQMDKLAGKHIKNKSKSSISCVCKCDRIASSCTMRSHLQRSAFL